MLLPVLQREGHDVRALSRHPDNLAGLPAEALRGDAVPGEGLERALDGVEVAYYLIHSMEPSPGGVGFVERERLAALNFGAAAQAAGVRRIVYLGGLVPRWAETAGGARGRGSRHLARPGEVRRVPPEALPDSPALCGSIVIRARSRSFRLLVRLV